MKLPRIIEEKLDELILICNRFGVKQIFAFGSVVTTRFSPDESDLDFFVEMDEMPPLARGEKLIAFWEACEDLFARRIDLVTEQSIRNPYFRSNVERTKQLIYDRAAQEVLK